MKITVASLAVLGGLTSFVLLVGAGKLSSYGGELGNSPSSSVAHRYGRSDSIAVSAASVPGGMDGAAGIAGNLTPAAPFDYHGGEINKERAAECLAAAAWYEAGDDATGQRAVIQTVINRVGNRGFPNSVCGVVFQGSQLPTGCQFTFTCDGSLDSRQPSAAARNRSLVLAKQALSGFVDGSVGDATHYHANYVTPWWSAKLERLTAIGSHIFYRWSGSNKVRQGRVKLAAEAVYGDLVAQARKRKPVEELEGTAIASDKLAMIKLDAAQARSAERPDRNSSVFYIPVSNSVSAGQWALSAMGRCKDREDCQVVGYASSETAEQNLIRGVSEKDRPLFLFVRDSASGMDIALWDCERVNRPTTSQCLPIDKRALTRLMRYRS